MGPANREVREHILQRIVEPARACAEDFRGLRANAIGILLPLEFGERTVLVACVPVEAKGCLVAVKEVVFDLLLIKRNRLVLNGKTPIKRTGL